MSSRRDRASAAILIVNPTSGAAATVGSLRKVLADLNGRTIGFFSNNKPNAAAVLERLEEQLRERFGIAGRRYTKSVPSLAADGPLLDGIASECDAVVIAGFD
jgi:hypothetical protein